MGNLGPTTVFGDLDINGSIGGAVRVAYVKTTPGATNIVAVYLDNDSTGEEVNVTCSVLGLTNWLNEALPLLTDGDQMFVAKINDTWYCLNLFHVDTSSSSSSSSSSFASSSSSSSSSSIIL